MAYVSGFDHDIFLSYAIVDNATFPGVKEGWVTSFVKSLEVSLSQLIGRSGRLEIWWDRTQLSENQPLDKQIQLALEKTACLVVVLSQGFLESPWCPKELETFRKAADKQGRSDSRIFVVDLGTVTEQQCRDTFPNYKPFIFWTADATKRRRPLGFPEPDGNELREYYGTIRDLAGKIKDEFDQIQVSGISYANQKKASSIVAVPQAPAATDSTASAGPVVYIAETSDDLSGARKQLVAFLESHHFRVACGGRNAVDFDSWKEAASRELAQATCFVQLLGMYPGRELDGACNGIVRLQHELAVESGKKVVQWRAPDLLGREFDDLDHLEFVKNAAAIESPLEAFKAEVKRIAAPPPPEKVVEKKSPAFGHDEPLTVFIHAGVEDVSQTQWLAKELTELNCWVSTTLTEGEPESIREDLEANLLDCDVLIVFYGQIPTDWVRAQFRTFPRIFPKRNRMAPPKPLKALAICNGEPLQKPAHGINVPGLQCIDMANVTSREVLAQWVDQLRNGGDE